MFVNLFCSIVYSKNTVVAVPELLSTVRTKLKELVEVVCIKLSYKGILSQSVLGSRQASEEGKIRRGGASCLAFGCVALVFALFSSLRFFRFCFRSAVLELEFP